MREPYDLLIIGGGINGVGIARDAAGRGLRVLLCEQEDLAWGTSSASSKLIHGGLRYLEYFEFRLVREALAEREVLISLAPHMIRPMRFILPHDHTLRPMWMIRAGLFLYDHLSGRRRLRGSYRIDMRRHLAGKPLQERIRKGFVYSDCWADDARLVVLNALDAHRRGAEVRTRTAVRSATRTGGGTGGLWHVKLAMPDGTPAGEARAHCLINAAGPWIGNVLEQALHAQPGNSHLQLVKGSHLVVPRLYEGDHAYILQHVDRRVIFVLPFLGEYSLIGTTDEAFEGDPHQAEMSAAESEYLCGAVSRFFRQTITPSDVVWSFAGVRPLYSAAKDANNPSAISREYELELEDAEGAAPLLSVIGGKITAYRQVAQHAMEKLRPYLEPRTGSLGAPWTHSQPLPGGDLPNADPDAALAGVARRWPWLPEGLATRLFHAHGTRMDLVLGDACDLPGLGRHFGGTLYQREVAYLVRHEWARTAEDILWRRTKEGLALNAAQVAELEGVIQEMLAEQPR